MNLTLIAIDEDGNEDAPYSALLAKPESFLDRLQQQSKRKDSRLDDDTPSKRLNHKMASKSAAVDTSDFKAVSESQESVSAGDQTPHNQSLGYQTGGAKKSNVMFANLAAIKEVPKAA